MSTQDQIQRATLVKATVPTGAEMKWGKNDTLTIEEVQTTFLASANGKQWADSIDDFNLSQQKTGCFALRYFYRKFNGYSKTQITGRRNGFIENAFLDYAVKMCLWVKHTPMSKLKELQSI